MKADWNHRLDVVVLAGYVLENSKKNILGLLALSGTVARVDDSVRELMEAGAGGGFCGGQGYEWGDADLRQGSSVGEVAGPELVFHPNAFGIENHNTELSRCLQSHRSFHRNQLVQSFRSFLQNCLIALKALVTDASAVAM